MTSPFPLDWPDELDDPEKSTDCAGDEAPIRGVDHLTCTAELELPPELIGVPFS